MEAHDNRNTLEGRAPVSDSSLPEGDAIHERRRRRVLEELLQEFDRAIGRTLAGATLDTFRISKEPAYAKLQRNAMADLRDYQTHLADRLAEGVGLWLAGPCGTGKDHLLCSLLRVGISNGLWIPPQPEFRDLSKEYREPYLPRHRFRYVTSGSSLFAEFRQAMKDETEEATIGRYSRTDLLVLSDPIPPIGSLTPHQAGMLLEIVDRRNRHGRPTWTAVNVANQDEADARMGAAIVDRLQHGAVCLELNWPSYRTQV